MLSRLAGAGLAQLFVLVLATVFAVMGRGHGVTDWSDVFATWVFFILYSAPMIYIFGIFISYLLDAVKSKNRGITGILYAVVGLLGGMVFQYGFGSLFYTALGGCAALVFFVGKTWIANRRWKQVLAIGVPTFCVLLLIVPFFTNW